MCNKVKAVSYTSEVRGISSTTFSITNPQDFTCQSDYCDYEIQASDTNAITSKQIGISGYDTTQYDVVAFNFIISNPVSTGGTQSSYICTEWEVSGRYYNCSNITGTGQTGVIQNHDINNLGIQARAIYTDGGQSYCSIENNKIYCPTYKKQIGAIEIITNQKTRWITYILVRIYRVAENYRYATTAEAIEQQTEDIIQSQENQTQQQIESQMVCYMIDKNKIIKNGYYLQTNGNEATTTQTYGITDYIKATKNDKLKIIETVGSTTPRICFYNINKTVISCLNANTITDNITIPDETSYIKITINYETNKPQYQICKNGNQAIIDGDLNNTPTNSFTNETAELNNYSTAEDQVLNSLDFSGVNSTAITINPNASVFIWSIVDRLRSMSSAIVLLMTSIFGIGIIKLVLNR